MDLGATSADAFSIPWNIELGWISRPPALLVPTVLCHLNSGQGSYILVVLRWQKVFWRPDLKSRAMVPPIPIRNKLSKTIKGKLRVLRHIIKKFQDAKD
nr:unnamed protein product [Callosobruchus analis]